LLLLHEFKYNKQVSHIYSHITIHITGSLLSAFKSKRIVN